MMRDAMIGALAVLAVGAIILGLLSILENRYAHIDVIYQEGGNE